MNEKKKWYTGKSPRTREQEAKEIIFQTLPPDGTEMSWSSLKGKAKEKGLSSTTLSVHLRGWVMMGLATRRVDDSAYPPRVYYSRRDPYLFLMKFSEQARLCAEIDLVGDIVDKGKFKPGTEGFYEQAVNVNLLFMKAALPVILYASLGGKGPYVFGLGELAREGAIDEHLKKVHEDMHALADELLDVVIRPWVHKMLDVLEIFSSSNKEVLEEVARPALEEAATAQKRYNELLEPYKKR